MSEGLSQLLASDLTWMPSRLKLQLGQLVYQAHRMCEVLDAHIHEEDHVL